MRALYELPANRELRLECAPRYETFSRMSDFTVHEVLGAIGTQQRPARLHSKTIRQLRT
jgi:hypothetical protein